MTLSIKEHIFWLQISINNITLVKATYSLDNFCRVYLGLLLSKPSFFSEIGKKFTTIEKIDCKVKLGFCLEGIVKPNDVRITDLFQDISLSLRFDE